MEISPTSLADGCNVIRRYVVELPGTPGVYRMLDANGNVLYVGKAKNLKARVQSYLNVKEMGTRLQRMVSQTVSMEIVTTRSEAEALLLEANLVKKFSPRYNILLKDDKSFPYIFFSSDHDFSRISKHRGAKTRKGKYFGPFTSGQAVNETVTLLQKAFLLRPCADSIFKNRTRPCLQYQIKRCSAPCVGKISKEDYQALVDQALSFMSGKNRQIQDELIQEMQALSLKMNYEKARVVRDRIKALAHVQQYGSTLAVGDADVIAIARDGRQCCIQLFSFRGGRNYGNEAFFPQHTLPYSDGEIIATFIGRRYQTQPPPGLILTSHFVEETALLEEALRLNNDYKIEIVHPVRGEKRELVEEAMRNAREALVRHTSMHVAQQQVMEKVKELFGLEDAPQRIEVYDNSHISGTHAVGAMIVVGPEGFDKKEYRMFNIKSEELVPGDDYGMMREVLTRRFKHLQESEDERVPNPAMQKRPDLVVIDGGLGQLNAALNVFEDLGIQGIALAAIAKGPERNAGRERIFLPDRDEPIQLPHEDSTLHFLQRVRDEAHRFAISGHRNRRGKSLQSSQLDSIPFIGPGRKKALLHHFGSARAVAAASQEEIARVPGISSSTAKVIYSFFHGEEQGSGQ